MYDEFDPGTWFCAMLDLSQRGVADPNFKILSQWSVSPGQSIFKVLNRNNGAVYEVSISEIRGPA